MLYDIELREYLDRNDDAETYRGQGVWIKENTPPEIVEELRAIHESAVSGGSPYTFLDFLIEDIEKGVVEVRDDGNAYRKGTRPPKLDLAARRERRRRDEEK